MLQHWVLLLHTKFGPFCVTVDSNCKRIECCPALTLVFWNLAVVMMQAQREAPADMQCKDKFLVQSVIAPEGGLNTEVSQEMVRVSYLGRLCMPMEVGCRKVGIEWTGGTVTGTVSVSFVSNS